MKKVTIYTDGACSGNPGPGGWGAIIIYGENKKELSGYDSDTTNNRMELLAAIRALDALKERCEIIVYSDSAYMVNAFNNGWLNRWSKNGWLTQKKERVENQDLWLMLIKHSEEHLITWAKVRGHADDVYNNRCDELARGAIKQIQVSKEADGSAE